MVLVRAGPLQLVRLLVFNIDEFLKILPSIFSESDSTIEMEEATEIEQEPLSESEPPARSTTPPAPPNMTLRQSVSQFPSQFLGSSTIIPSFLKLTS